MRVVQWFASLALILGALALLGPGGTPTSFLGFKPLPASCAGLPLAHTCAAVGHDRIPRARTDHPGAYKAFFQLCNAELAPRWKRLLRASGRLLSTMGARHLVGDDGIPSIFEDPRRVEAQGD